MMKLDSVLIMSSFDEFSQFDKYNEIQLNIILPLQRYHIFNKSTSEMKSKILANFADPLSESHSLEIVDNVITLGESCKELIAKYKELPEQIMKYTDLEVQSMANVKSEQPKKTQLNPIENQFKTSKCNLQKAHQDQSTKINLIINADIQSQVQQLIQQELQKIQPVSSPISQSQIDQIKKIVVDFDNAHDDAANLVEKISCDTTGTCFLDDASEKMINKGIPNLGAYRCYQMIQKVRFNGQTFSCEFSSGNNEDFKKTDENSPNTNANGSHFPVFTLRSDGTFIKWDVTSHCRKFVKYLAYQKQFGTGMQVEMLKDDAKCIDISDKEEDDKNIQNTVDAYLRPDKTLKYRVESCWKVFTECMNESNAKNLMMDTIKQRFLDEQSEVKLYKEARAALEKALQIYEIKEYRDEINKRRYQLEYLMENSHIQTLERIWQMHKMLHEYVAKAQKEPPKVQEVSQEKKKEISDSAMLKVLKERVGQVIQVESRLVKPQENEQAMKNFLSSCQQELKKMQDTDMQKLENDHQKQVTNLNNQITAEVIQYMQNIKKETMSGNNDKEMIKLAQIVENEMYINQQKLNNICQNMFSAQMKTLDSKITDGKNSILKLCTSQSKEDRMTFASLLYQIGIDLTDKRFQASVYAQMKQYMKEIKGLQTHLQPQNADFEIKLNNKTFTSSKQVLDELLKDNSIVALTIPSNDPLSPLVENSSFWEYSNIYNCGIQQCNGTTITLFVINHYNLKQDIYSSMPEVPKLVVHAQDCNFSKIIPGNFTASSCGAPVQCSRMALQLISGRCNAQDIVNVMHQFGEGKRRNVLNITEFDEGRWNQMIRMGLYQFDFINITIKIEQEERLTQLFPLNQKYRVFRGEDTVTLLIGGVIDFKLGSIKKRHNSIQASKHNQIQEIPKQVTQMLNDQRQEVTKLISDFKEVLGHIKVDQANTNEISLDFKEIKESGQLIQELIGVKEMVKNNKDLSKEITNGLSILVQDWLQILESKTKEPVEVVKVLKNE